MSGKYFSMSSPPTMFLLVALGFGLCLGVPVSKEPSTSTVASTTVKILVPPPADDDDDAIIIEAGNGTSPSLPQQPFSPMDCFEEKVKGPCRAIIDQWYFNKATNLCEQFQYSGCGGNGNRFGEKEECEKRCAGGAKSDQKVDDDTDSIIIDSGKLDDNGTCPEFDGCGPLKCAEITDEKTGCKKCACSFLPDDDDRKTPVGSVSGTPSEDEENKQKNKPEDICGLPEVRGDCRAMVTRFRYDAKIKKCVMFHFGGCNSNGNNFVSEEKCNAFCKGQ